MRKVRGDWRYPSGCGGSPAALANKEAGSLPPAYTYTYIEPKALRITTLNRWGRRKRQQTIMTTRIDVHHHYVPDFYREGRFKALSD